MAGRPARRLYPSPIRSARFNAAPSIIHCPLSDAWWFWQQAAARSYEIPPDGTIDTDLR